MDLQDQNEHYGDDQRPQYLAGLTICIIIIVVSVGARLYAQCLIHQVQRLDNGLLVIAAACTLASNALCIAALGDGMGLHTYRVVKEDPDPPRSLIYFEQKGYAISIIQNLSVMFVKLSILFFYHRVFTNRIRFFRTSLIVVGVYVTLVGIGSTIEFIVQCLPIRYFFTRVYLITGIPNPDPVKGWCMPQTLHVAFPLMAGLVSDVVILVLPAAGLWSLQMARARKLSVYFALSLGVLACAIEIVRIYYCFQTKNSGDITWTNAGSLVWSGVEPSVAVLCANIPAMAPLLRKFRREQSRQCLEQQRGPVRTKTYTTLHDTKTASDNESIAGLREGVTPALDGSLAVDEPYSCVATYDASFGNDQGPEPGIAMDVIQVSKQLDISHGPKDRTGVV